MQTFYQLYPPGSLPTFWGDSQPSKSELKLALENINLEDESAYQILVQALTSNVKEYNAVSAILQKILNQVPEDPLQCLIFQVSLKEIEQNQKEWHLRCLNLLTPEKLESLARFVSDEFQSAQESAKSLCYKLDAMEKIYKKESFIKKEYNYHYPLLFRFVSNLLDALMSTFSLLDIRHAPGTYYETKYLLDIYWRFLTVPFLVLQCLLAYFQNPLKAFSVFSVASVVSTFAIYSYFRWLKPVPNKIEKAENLTDHILSGKGYPVYYADSGVKKLTEALIANNTDFGVRKHPVLVGKTGIGKTSLIQAAASYFANGADVPPELKGKKVFRFSTMALCKGNDYSFKKAVDTALEEIESYGDNIVVVLGNFKTILDGVKGNEDEEKAPWRILLDLLDKAPHIIAELSLTQEQYHEMIESNPNLNELATRLQPIFLTEKTKAETLSILRKMSDTLKDIEIEEGVLEDIYKTSRRLHPNEFQPAPAQHLFSSLVSKLKNDRAGCEELKEKSREIQKNIDELNSQLAQINYKKAGWQKRSRGIQQKIEEAEAEKKEIDDQIKDKQQALKKYDAIHQAQKWREEELYQIAKRIMEASCKNTEIHPLTGKKFIYYCHSLLPALEKAKSEIAKTHSLKIALTKEMVCDNK